MSHATLCFLSYERFRFLPQAIDTALAGIGDELVEVIVHDDGSTDPDLLRYLYTLHQRGEISSLILNAPGINQGVGEAVRKCFAAASGEVLVKIDQDLVFKPGWLDFVMQRLQPYDGRLVPLEDKDGRVHGCTIVDADDYEVVTQFRWRLHNGGYAFTRVNKRTILLHRLLMKPGNYHVDHCNGRKLDNRRANLRVVTPGANMENRSGGYGSSRWRGVSWNAKDKRWCAFGKKQGRAIYLGGFEDELEAAATARVWRAENYEHSIEPEDKSVDAGMVGLFHYHIDPVDTAKCLRVQREGWQEHTHFCGSAFAIRRELYDVVGINTHFESFGEDWELMRLVDGATPFVNALPDEDLVENVGFGIGPSTVVVQGDQGPEPRKIHQLPKLVGRPQ